VSGSITTSIRLSPKIRRALELKAKQEKRGKNWIISRALENYLETDAQFDLAAEAQRQSRIVAEEESIDWATDADLGQWK
jgi:predicted DNA-binding protein